MQAKKQYLPGLVVLTLVISTLLIVLAVHSADAAVPTSLGGGVLQGITPSPTPNCNTAWRGVPSPNASSQPNYLTAIDALAPDDVWAVGHYTGTGRYLTLTQHWDGQEWTIIPSPNPGANSHFLSAVEMIAANDVWAVGSFDNDPVNNTRHLLTMHWNGSKWSVVPNPDPGGNYDNFLTGVAAVSSDDVWAVGFWRQSSPQGLILHWDGSQWVQVANPATGTWDSMNAIEVVSGNDIWAVGYTSSDTSYIWHWDGMAWSAVPSPNAGPLNAVDAIASNDVWAAGNHGVVMRWDGAAWNVVSNPNIGAVYGLAALAPNDVWAVGAMLAHWNGTGWTSMPTPATGALRGVSALAATNIWAAGDYTIGSINRTLINRYSYGCTTPTPVSTASTPTPSPTRVPLTCLSLQDSISNSDPVQIGMLSSSLTPSPCNFNGLPCPGVADSTPRHYKSYRYHFPFGSFSSTCLTVKIDATGCPGNLFSAAYLGGYNPNNVCGGLRGATGDVVSGSASYQFVVYRGFDLVIVVHEVGPNTGCSNYTLTVSTDTVCNLATPIPPTPTSTAPTQSPTRTPIATAQAPSPSATPTACAVVDYTYSVTPISPDDPAETSGTETKLLERSQCSGCTVPVALPFPFTFYGQTYEAIGISSRGTLHFGLAGGTYHSCPFPILQIGPSMLPYWSEFEITWGGIPPDPCMQNYGIPCGVYTSTTGKSPDRVFNVHWVGVLVGSNHETVNFEARLHETTGVFDFVYHGGIQFGSQGSIGIQEGPSRFTSYACNTTAQLQNIQIRWTPVLVPCPSATPTRTATQTRTTTATATATGTATNTPRPPTQTPGGASATTIPTGTTAPTASATAICALQMADVLPGNAFYPYVRCLTCMGIIGGYPCGGQGEPCNPGNDPYFRTNNGITRGQIAKIVSEAASFTEDAGPQAYEDVPAGSPFYAYINRLSNRGLVGGYTCGQMPGEPCVGPGNRPYFRPNTGATRGQLAKIVATAAGINEPVTGQFYADVPATNPFYEWIERLTSRGVMGGYRCGSGPGEPCDDQDRPYFRWAADITRGQASKIVANTFVPGCLVSTGQ